MSKPRTILLIPTDPKLLEGGPCGYRPPSFWEHPDFPGMWLPAHIRHDHAGAALVLAHEGTLLPHGCLAAVPEALGAYAALLDAVRTCLRGYTVVWPAGMEGEIVLLDADGQVMV